MTIGNMLPEDLERDQRTVERILDELVRQVQTRLNGADDAAKIMAALQSEAFSRMYDEVLLRWDTICQIERYVAVALGNLLQ